MRFCSDCGRRIIPDESGLCDRCLSDAWSEVRQRGNVWDVDGLRASVEDRPLPKPRRKPQARTAGD